MNTAHLTPDQIKQLNLAYLPRKTVLNSDDYIEAAGARSAEVRKTLTGHLDISYGDTPLQALDIFPAKTAKAPVLVFIHGGYWRALDKSFYSDIAPPFVEAGATVVLINYDLCPAVTIPDIVSQIRKALVWIHENIGRYHGNPDNVHLTGHSAGGHLTGMMMATDWAGKYALPPDFLKSAAPLSGLFDIEPHRHTELQPDIHLTAEDAARHSPQNLPLFLNGPILCAVGGGESDAFKQQSLDFAEKCRTAGMTVEYFATGNDNHFEITDRLGKSKDPLTRKLLALMEL